MCLVSLNDLPSQVLNVRWATEDPNPHVQQRKQAAREHAVSQAVSDRFPDPDEDEFAHRAAASAASSQSAASSSSYRQAVFESIDPTDARRIARASAYQLDDDDEDQRDQPTRLSSSAALPHLPPAAIPSTSISAATVSAPAEPAPFSALFNLASRMGADGWRASTTSTVSVAPISQSNSSLPHSVAPSVNALSTLCGYGSDDDDEE